MAPYLEQSSTNPEVRDSQNVADMEAIYPYAVKTQRKARNAPSRGHFVPKPLVGGFRCLELVLYGIRELA